MKSVVGDDLLKENYPQVHAVGRAADSKHAPRVVELRSCYSSLPTTYIYIYREREREREREKERERERNMITI